MKKIIHDYKCDNCGKPATLNLQNNWQLYEILYNGCFIEKDTWEGDSNEFYCDDCYKKEVGK